MPKDLWKEDIDVFMEELEVRNILHNYCLAPSD